MIGRETFEPARASESLGQFRERTRKAKTRGWADRALPEIRDFFFRNAALIDPKIAGAPYEDIVQSERDHEPAGSQSSEPDEDIARTRAIVRTLRADGLGEAPNEAFFQKILAVLKNDLRSE